MKRIPIFAFTLLALGLLAVPRAASQPQGQAPPSPPQNPR